MNRCPSCQNLVPAGWIACRRCGAALSVARGGANGAGSSRGGSTTVLQVAPTLAPVRDTMLPGGASEPEPKPRAERDSLLPFPRSPSTTPDRLVDRVDRRVLIAAGALGVIIVGALAFIVWPSGGSTTRERKAAQALLQRTAGAAHTFYTQDHDYNRITRAAIATRVRPAHVVSDATGASPGEISIWIEEHTLIAATAVGTQSCLFARTDPKTAKVEFATAGAPCAASAAPKGWTH